jgi:hypothetical protein
MTQDAIDGSGARVTVGLTVDCAATTGTAAVAAIAGARESLSGSDVLQHAVVPGAFDTH